MTLRRVGWLAAAVALAVVVAIQVMVSDQRSARFVAQAQTPTVAAGIDPLAGLAEIPIRVRGNDYRRAAFGEAWDDENSAPGGRNGCDTRFLGGFGMLRETLQEVGFKQGTLR
ncbi:MULTISPECIES: hypothetical protein [Mycolicibacterium]|uniref:hypothetical protein n=1 Tax=Mycolicibacterium TaxID=1866885 RepID=UPI0026A8B94F